MRQSFLLLVTLVAAPLAWAADAPMPPAATGGYVHGGVARTTDTAEIKVAKASGPDARTVAEIVAGRADLADKGVVVRGQVVRFTGGILGRNWIHIRDGSGSAAEGTHDILVTTQDEASVGDVVLVKGIVHTNRDFGSGYRYQVLIEEATLQK